MRIPLSSIVSLIIVLVQPSKGLSADAEVNLTNQPVYALVSNTQSTPTENETLTAFRPTETKALAH